jgi:cytochrome c peroxidase
MRYFMLFVLSFSLLSCNNETTSDSDTEKDPILEGDTPTSSIQIDEEGLFDKASSIFGVLPAAPSPNSPKALLGKRLYMETALSVNGKISCNSCHLLDAYGVDNLPTSPGHDGRAGDRNSPSVYNAALHIAQFWDGRAADLTEQAKGPILNPIEMGLPNEKAAVDNIKSIAAYAPMFEKAFGNKADINYQNIAEAIAAFEQTLLTPSRFDEYLKGDKEALSTEEKIGMQTFINSGCIACHSGTALGGNMYQKFGLVQGPYWQYTGSKLKDKGRAEVTKNEADAFFFKTPSLRNVQKTAPYFHDGSVADLSKAIDIMAQTQLGKTLSASEIESIQVFLESLTGSIPTHTAL